MVTTTEIETDLNVQAPGPDDGAAASSMKLNLVATQSHLSLYFDCIAGQARRPFSIFEVVVLVLVRCGQPSFVGALFDPFCDVNLVLIVANAGQHFILLSKQVLH